MALLVSAGVLAACSGSPGGHQDSRDPSARDIVGTWRAADGRTAEFSEDGSVILRNIPCTEVLPGSSGPGVAAPGQPLQGKWKVRTPRMGGARWVGFDLAPGPCGNTGPSESGFYISQETRDLILHLRDPDMTNEDLDFSKQKA
ncbi:hypothetical protein [Streptomyces kanamyceticus]|nr:hypothetical protein [Streptomyces kanamyceticus]